MNVKDIAALAEIVRKNELTKLEIDGERIVMERVPAAVQAAAAAAPAAPQTVAGQMHAAEPIAEVQEKEGAYVRSLLGRAVEVLIEEEETGYSREYVRVRVPGAREGEIVRAAVEDVQGQTAVGRPLA